MTLLIGSVRALLARTYNRYILASGMALIFDLGCFLVLLRTGMPAMPASAAGYCLGIVIHWLASTRFVFGGRAISAGALRLRQKGLFVTTALLGLALTAGIVGGAVRAGFDPRVAKLMAIAISFHVTYFARRAMVFRP